MSKLRQKPSPDGLPSAYDELISKYGTYLTFPQVMEVMHFKRNTIKKMISKGVLKGKKIGHEWRFAACDVARAMQ